MPEPFGNSSAVAVYHCALQARKAGFDFMLAGDGGDEIFGGNARYAKQFVFERYSRIPAFLRTGLLEPGVRAALSGTGLSLLRKAQSYIEQAKVPLPDRLQSYNYLHRNQLSDVFSAAFLQDINPDEPLEMLREEYRSCSSDEPLDRMLQLDWRFTLHDNDLVKVNSMCRLAGTDVAYPMLDRELVDFACQLPTDWKIRRGDLRWFYRTAMRGFLPDLIIDKEKHGFGLPFGVWTRTHDDLRGIAESSVAALSKRGIFQDEFLKDTLQKHRDVHAGYYGELIWILMILEIWLQKHAPDVGV
jgi:asparagine synthase (glutamine-hydrolysing)